MSFQIIGNANNAIPEVETNTLAARVNFQPVNSGGIKGGIYKICQAISPGVGTSASASNAPFFSLQWISKNTIGRIRKVTVSPGVDSTTTANPYIIKLWRAAIHENYDTSAVLLPNPDSRVRATMPFMTHLEYANFDTQVNALSPVSVVTNGVAAMSGGVVVLDNNPLAVITTSKSTTAFPNPGIYARPIPFALLDAQAGDIPLELSHKVGAVLTFDMPNTTSGSSLTLAVDIVLEEMPIDLA